VTLLGFQPKEKGGAYKRKIERYKR